MIGDPGGSFWNHTERPEFQLLATDFAVGRGWRPGIEYGFELIYERDRIRISIDGQLVFDVSGSFQNGRFGFYNFSQSRVTYRSFISTTVFEAPPGDTSSLVKNDDDTFTRTFLDGSRMNFDAAGRQTALVDRAGRTTKFGYL